jgi:hypothetical protein
VHTDLPTEVAYQASSPGELNKRMKIIRFKILILDEFALVTAMQQMGCVFFSRTPESVIINFVNKRTILFCFIRLMYFSEVKKKNIKF